MRRNSKRARGRGLTSRPFYTTVLLLSILTAYSFIAQPRTGRGHDEGSAGLSALSIRSQSTEPQCDDVHRATDQCAFVNQYCQDDDAGLLPYLQFYYCHVGNAKPVAFIILVIWLGLLFTTIGIAASDFFSVNLSTIAAILGLSESLAGVTFLAFGNGSPDVFSTFAAMGSNSASMAVGELIGAASFITGVVAGSMALVREFRVDKKTYARDICFFIVAVCFTMFFLADGHLRFWECCIMIAYYLVYVVTVVGQHWYMTRRRQRLRREGEARSHVYGAVGATADDLAGEPYRDDPDDIDGRSTPGIPDVSVLEQGPRIEVEGQVPPATAQDYDEDLDEDHERMVAAEVTSSMRVLRTRGKRSNTLNPIRPSLVGVLEFRSALAQLQREGNLKLSTMPGHAASYSESMLGSRPRRLTADTARQAQYLTPTTEGVTLAGRARALSSGDAPTSLEVRSELFRVEDQAAAARRSPSPTQSHSYTIGGNLAPPPGGPSGLGSIDVSPGATTPNLRLLIPSTRSSQASSPISAFPRYTDSPAMLTPNPHAEPTDYFVPGPVVRERSFPELPLPGDQPKPIRWWPYTVLPPPHALFATLFPTLQGWGEKTIWDQFVSAISVPSIFLLVITLPVVENDTDDTASVAGMTLDHASHGNLGHIAPPVSTEHRSIEHETEWERYRRHAQRHDSGRYSSRDASPHPPYSDQEETLTVLPTDAEGRTGPPLLSKATSDAASISNGHEESMSWNRWLVCLQIFTGPLFSVFVLWANMREDLANPGRSLLKMTLYTLLGSSILLALLLFLTSEQRRPKHHYVLCFMGFVISIAWISTIAGEVVGVLKTFGVVMGISEALLGLTIFAAGNSVGDLVADITVARLGYPVMALAACFGGPMLNILLGIGIGGVLMMVQKANHQHQKHPEKPIKYGPYRVQVGGTLMISAITLLVILVGLLIAVPMNKWILSRRIGWTLIAMWVISTTVNVIVELTGVWGELA